MRNNYIRSGLYLMCVLVLFIKGRKGFFIKHSASGLCLKVDDTPFAGKPENNWGYNYYVTFYDGCLHSHAQFRYVDKKFVHNIEKIGTFFGREGEYSERFIVYSNKSATASFVRSDEFALKHKSGFLKIYNGTYCATPDRLTKPFDGAYPKRTTTCDQELQKFIFGSVTNKDSTKTDVNCASTQKMDVVKAEFGQCSADGKSFVYDNDTKCSSFALCFLKGHCDGKNSCNMTANYNLFKLNQCPKTSSQLYMEYNCVDTPGTVITTVSKIRLSQVPYRGSIEVFDGTTWIKANDNTWSKEKEVALCHHLGFINTKNSSGAVQETVLAGQNVPSGNLYCYGTQPTSTSCCAQFVPSTLTQNSKISYVECLICNEPLLQNSAIFPNSIFSASDANGYKARLYANGWCPTNSGSKYLQIDLQTEYYITHIVTFGDKAQTKWLESYSLQYSSTVDRLDSSKMKTITANHDAYRASIIRLDIVHARYLKIIPKQGRDFCLRVELCGHVLLPDQVQNVILHITGRSARVSWSLPQNERQSNVTYFLVSLNGTGQEHNILRLGDTNQYTFSDLKPYKTYTVNIKAGNAYGVGKSVSVPFTTVEAAPSGPPLHIKVIAQSSTSLYISWDAPDIEKRNGVITNFTICLSHVKDGSCSKKYITESYGFLVTNLGFATKYFVRVLASTKKGTGIYSGYQEQSTKGKPLSDPFYRTTNVLWFLFHIPKDNVSFYEVIAVSIQNNSTPTRSPDTYRPEELSHYNEVKDNSQSTPYIAATFKVNQNELCQVFNLGDGVKYSKLYISAGVDSYFNGPLKNNGAYRVFLRFFKDQNNFYSSDWSPLARTNSPENVGMKAATESSDEGFSKTVFYVVISILLIIITVLVVVVIYMYLCLRRPRLHPPAKDRVVASVNNETFSNDPIYDEVQNPSLPSSNLEDRNSSAQKELDRSGEEKDQHSYQSLVKPTV